MDSMMEKLYYGLLSPGESETEDILYVERMKEYRHHIAEIDKLLGEEQPQLRQHFEKVREIVDDLVACRGEDMFYKGFSMGSRLTAEALLLENQ